MKDVRMGSPDSSARGQLGERISNSTSFLARSLYDLKHTFVLVRRAALTDCTPIAMTLALIAGHGLLQRAPSCSGQRTKSTCSHVPACGSGRDWVGLPLGQPEDLGCLCILDAVPSLVVTP